MKVRDVMSPEVEVLRPNDTLQTAAQLMADLDAAVLPVGEEDRLIGMITDRDIAMRVAAEGRDPQQVTVRQAMSSDVFYPKSGTWGVALSCRIGALGRYGNGSERMDRSPCG